MAGFFSDLLQALREGRGSDMRFLCRHLLSERGEASQTALAQEIITAYQAMTQAQRVSFFRMLCGEFSPDEAAILRAAADYQESPDAHNLAKLTAAVESPRQELLRRINTAPHGTEVLVALREHVQQASSSGDDFSALDADLNQLFRSWFNRGFLRLERISWQTSAAVLEKLIRYESVHEINGWPDLQRRLEADRRCFAFFHSALPNEPIIFVEVALSRGLTGDMGPLLDIETPVLSRERANTTLFYSINNCRDGLRGIPFGNFLIKQVVTELAAELPKIKIYSTVSPLPRLARALNEALTPQPNAQGFTRDRLCRLVTDFAADLTAAGCHDSVEALFRLLEDSLAYRDVLAAPLERLALAYIAQARQGGRLYDPVAIFHLSNGARLERINAFGNRRSYGLEASYGVTVNYRYPPDDLEENHERFVRHGQIRVSSNLYREYRIVAEAWNPVGIKSSVRVTR